MIDVSGVPAAERRPVRAALVDASVDSFRIGIGLGAGLAILGGLVALVGIQIRGAGSPAPTVRVARSRGRARTWPNPSWPRRSAPPRPRGKPGRGAQ